MKLRLLTKLGRDERGASIIELALAAPNRNAAIIINQMPLNASPVKIRTNANNTNSPAITCPTRR